MLWDAQVREADTVHPLASFHVRGRYYYVDADHFENKALLVRLTPQAAAAHAMATTEQMQQQEQGGERQGQAAQQQPVERQAA